MALLTAQELRISQHDHDVIDGVDFALQGPHAIVLGAPSALFASVAGIGTYTGSLTLEGTPVQAGVVEAMPAAWTALDWLTWRLRLAGMSSRLARTRGLGMLESFELGAHATVALGKASVLMRRALPLIAALALQLPGPEQPVVLFDDAFGGLDDDAAGHLASLFVRLAGQRRWIGFLPWLSSRSALAAAAAELLVLDGGRVVAKGTPAALLTAERTFVVRVLGEQLAWSAKLEERGIALLSERQWLRPEGSGKELTVALPGELGPRDLFALTAESSDVIVELFPAAGKLA